MHTERHVQHLIRIFGRWQVWFVILVALVAHIFNPSPSTEIVGIAGPRTGEQEVAIRAGDAQLPVDTKILDDGSVQAEAAVGSFASSIRKYIIQRGDTVKSIASRFGISVETITSVNPETKKSVSVGREISILPTSGIVYQITDRDSVASIAERFGIDAELIKKYNPNYQELFANGSGRVIVPVKSSR